MGCVLLAVAFGIAHDLVTAHLCLEYFTVGHDPPPFLPHRPLVMALFYGVFATWWVGVLLGCPLALAAQVGSRPPVPPASLRGPVMRLLVGLYGLAVVAGLTGYALASLRWVYLVEPFASRVPLGHQAAFLACGFAHAASYLGGFAGGLALIVLTWRRRSEVSL